MRQYLKKITTKLQLFDLESCNIVAKLVASAQLCRFVKTSRPLFVKFQMKKEKNVIWLDVGQKQKVSTVYKTAPLNLKLPNIVLVTFSLPFEVFSVNLLGIG